MIFIFRIACVLMVAGSLGYAQTAGKDAWLDGVAALRGGDQRSFQFRETVDALAGRVVIYVSWSPPNHACVIVTEQADGLPLMIAVDGRVLLYDLISGRILLIHALPTVNERVRAGIFVEGWGIRTSFPDQDSLTTINIDFASIFKQFAKRSPESLRIAADSTGCVYSDQEARCILRVDPAVPRLPSFYRLQAGEGIEAETYQFDSFVFGAPLPRWHRSLDEALLSKRVPIASVADSRFWSDEERQQLIVNKELINEAWYFTIPLAARNEEVRKAMQRLCHTPVDFDSVRANDARLRNDWRKALAEQDFALPTTRPATQ